MSASHKFKKATVELRMRGEVTDTREGWQFFSACGHPLVAHKMMEGGKYWQVTEPATGYRLGSNAMSRELAADAAERILGRHPGELELRIRQVEIERGTFVEDAA